MAPVASLLLDRRLVVVQTNPAFSTLTQISPEGSVGQTPEIILGLQANVIGFREQLRGVLAGTARLRDCVVQAQLPKLGPRILLLNADLLRVGSARRKWVLLSVYDITQPFQEHAEIRQRNVDLEQRIEGRTRLLQETTEEMEAFCYTIAHDLRAPLRAIEGFASAILEENAKRLAKPADEYLRRIIAAARRQDRLIEDLLEYTHLKMSVLPTARIHVGTILRDVLSRLRPEIQRCRAIIRVSPALPEVQAHVLSLERVLLHLLSNALKFTRSGVRTRVHIRSEVRGGRIRLWVEDNGIGIAPEHQERVFRVFERLHTGDVYPGTGIGLALVRKGMERMGGRAGVESEVGRGSRFWIEFPEISGGG